MRHLISALSEIDQITLAELAVNKPLKEILNVELYEVKERLCTLSIGDDLVKFACTYFALQEKVLYIEEFIEILNDLFKSCYQHRDPGEDS